MSIEEKRSCIDSEHPDLSVKRQCELMGLSRSSYYYPPLYAQGETEENLKYMRLIDEEYTLPFMGVGRCGTIFGGRDIRSTGNGYSVS